MYIQWAWCVICVCVTACVRASRVSDVPARAATVEGCAKKPLYSPQRCTNESAVCSWAAGALLACTAAGACPPSATAAPPATCAHACADVAACLLPNDTVQLEVVSGREVRLSSVLSTLHQLRSLRITHTPVTLFNDHTALHDSVPLKNLSVSCSNITNLTAVTAGVLQYTTSLVTLIITRSALQSIEADALRNLTALQELDLSHNQLTAIPQELFFGLHNLSKLVLDYNHITTLPDRQFIGVHTQLSLSLEHNALRHIAPNAFQGAGDGLRSVSLSHNALRNDDGQGNDPLSELQSVDVYLRDNCLSHIPDTFKSSNIYLNHLDLAENYITEIKERALDYAIHTPPIQIDLRNNHITTAKGKYSPVPILNLLLEGNPLICSGDLYPLVMSPKINIVDQPHCAGPQTLANRTLKTLPLYLLTSSSACGDCVCTARPHNNTREVLCEYVPKNVSHSNETVILQLTRKPLTLTHLPSDVNVLMLKSLQLTSVPDIAPNNTLTQLDLSNNSIVNVPFEKLFKFKHLTVNLSSNPLSCECSQRQLLLKYKGENRVIYEKKDCDNNCGGEDRTLLITLSGAALVVCALVMLVVILLWWYRDLVWETLYVWGVSKRRRRWSPARGRRWDVLVSLDDADGSWVVEHVLSRLPTDGVGVTLRELDGGQIGGVGELAAWATVTFAIVTPAYIKSLRCRNELRDASARGAVVALCVHTTPAAYRDFATVSNITAVQWSERRAWRRLYYHLPLEAPPAPQHLRPIPAGSYRHRLQQLQDADFIDKHLDLSNNKLHVDFRNGYTNLSIQLLE